MPKPRSLLLAVFLSASLPSVAQGTTAAAAEPVAPQALARYRVPSSIDRTGSRNVSAALQSFIDRVPDGSRIVFPARATYLLGGNGIALDGRRRLELVGNGTTLRSRGCGIADSLFAIGRYAASRDITISGFTLEGDNAAGGTRTAHDGACEYQMGFAIYRSSNIDIGGVTIRRVHGDCVYIGGAGTPFTWSDNIRFHDSVCTLQGRMGVAIVAGSNIRVERNEITEIGISAFDIEPNYAAGGATNVAFIGNTVGRVGVDDDWNPWVFEANGSADGVVRGVTLADNTLTASPILVKVQRANRFDITVRGNRSSVRAAGPVMSFQSTTGVTVTGNTQPLSSGQLASFSSCTNVTYQP